jgi:shikimate dehydrogenase
MPLMLGLIGYPVSRSASPAMHNAALAALGISGRYELIETPPGTFSQTLERVTREGFTGLNVTLPHKEEALSLADDAEASAQDAGAANVLYRRDGRWIAANTDGEGLYRSLSATIKNISGRRVIWLGAGGATRTAASALLIRGGQLVIAARDLEKASRVARSLGVRAIELSRAALVAEFARSELLIQATSATMSEEAGAELVARLPLEALPPGCVVCDLVYRPRETALLREAKRLGFAVVDGSGMLLHQGALAFYKFTGRSAPIREMERALLRELGA